MASHPTSAHEAAEVDRLSRHLLELMATANGEKRIVVGISGVPGSGKSTFAHTISAHTNALYQAQQSHNSHAKSATVAVDLPMDGFHYSRAQLAAMPDPETATHRRGAAFTFDAPGFRDMIQNLVQSPITAVDAPSFDHAVKDPIAGAIRVPTSALIVLVEGNYCALDRAPWSDAAKLMTEIWYLDIAADVAHKRVAARHLASGICADEKSAWERATGTDELNAKDIRENRLPCDEVLKLA